jgi:hypothetical protein
MFSAVHGKWFRATDLFAQGDGPGTRIVRIAGYYFHRAPAGLDIEWLGECALNKIFILLSQPTS